MTNREEIKEMATQFNQGLEKLGAIVMKKIEEGGEVTNLDLAGLLINTAGICACTFAMCKIIDEKDEIFMCAPEPIIYPASSNSCCGCTPEAVDAFNKCATQNFVDEFCKNYERARKQGGSCNG